MYIPLIDDINIERRIEIIKNESNKLYLFTLNYKE